MFNDYKADEMFATNTHQLSFAPLQLENNMLNSLQVNETASLFADNVMMASNGSCFPDGSTFHGNTASDSDFAKGIYNLRPRGSTPHLPVAQPKFEPEETPTPVKSKRQRNSLKKRLLVNARERDRMRVLNNGFQALRDALPCYIADGHMAKITTLRLAINYIKALNEVLNEEPPTGKPVTRCVPPLQHPVPTASSAPPYNQSLITNEPEPLKEPLPPIDVSSIQ